jgi:hypothetical protein
MPAAVIGLMESGMRVVAVMFVALVMLAGCSKSIHDSKDYARHSMSQLSDPTEGGGFVWFDVKLTPEYPDDNELAEDKRM